jgi:predicted GNAT superfamily acetyltransferase
MLSDLRDVDDLAGCRAVVDVQIAVWGHDAETVPASLLSASIKRGGLLVGAWDAGRLVGFVWSMPGWRGGQPTQWSHMLGVRPEARGRGLGEALKRAQRERALAAGVDLIEWTFDPLQAANAHLNLSRLGAIVSEYRVNAYGEMAGPLHRGTPTDRLIAAWWIRRPHPGRDEAVSDAPAALDVRDTGAWVACVSVRTDLDAPRVRVPVPPRFSEMQQQATDLALAWRLAARGVLTSYFSRGYRAVSFVLDRERGGGEYLLSKLEV